MSEYNCKDCAHFVQHYALGEKHIFRIYCGHCTFTRIRKKQPDSKICENFAPKDADEASFATKEYLSKTLLEYLVHLELLPPIRDVK